MKNAYGREGLGRSAVDRDRKGLKISILTDIPRKSIFREEMCVFIIRKSFFLEEMF